MAGGSRRGTSNASIAKLWNIVEVVVPTKVRDLVLNRWKTTVMLCAGCSRIGGWGVRTAPTCRLHETGRCLHFGCAATAVAIHGVQ